MANSFEKSFARELGKNTAKLASNALFGSHWATPYRRVESRSQKAYNQARANAANARAEAESVRAEAARARANAAIAEANNRIQIARDKHLNQIDAAVIANVDKLTMAPIPRTIEGIVEMMSTLSVQMRSIKYEQGEDDSEIRNKYLYALIERYRQCIFEIQCINPNDPHIPVYGQILVDKEYEIKQLVAKEKIKKISIWLGGAAVAIFLFLFVPMSGGNSDGSWNIPQFIITLVLLASIFCLLAIPALYILSNRKLKKQKEADMMSYRIISEQPKPVVENKPSKKNSIEEVKIEEPIAESFVDNSIFFDLNEDNRIGAALSRIWTRYKTSVPAELIERKPIFAADGVEDCILFVGVNPSFDPADDDYFLKNEDGKSLLYGSFYQRDDAPDYFKNLEDFAAQLGKSYVQTNLLYARENDRNKLMKVDSNFIREQLELTYDTIIKIKPKAILFFTTYCKDLIFGADRWVNPEVVKNGAYILNGTNIPVFFCPDVTTLTPTNREGMIELVRRAL